MLVYFLVAGNGPWSFSHYYMSDDDSKKK